MARTALTAALAVALAAAPALAASEEQRENRRILRDQDRQMRDLEFRRERDARSRERAMQNRVERDALELRLQDRGSSLRLEPLRR